MLNMALKFFLFSTLCFGVALCVKIEISPKQAKAGETDSVSIKCLAEGTNTNEIVVFEVLKDGSSIAVVTACTKVNCAKAHGDYVADGKIMVSDASKSYLYLKLAKPSSSHAGDYECSVDYMDNNLKLAGDKVNDTLKVEQMDPGKVEGAVIDLEERVDKLEQECCKSGSPGSQGGESQSAPVPQKMAMFAVSNNQEYKAIRGSRLTLPDVIMQHGPGYERSTGIFVAPWKGLYAFHLTVALAGKGINTVVQLKHNNDVLFRLYAGDKTFDDQTAASIGVVLEKGDRVYAFVEAITGSRLLDNRRYTVFSGYLVSALEN